MRMSYWQYQGTAHTGVARVVCSMRDLHGIFYAPGGDSYIYSLFTLLDRMERFPPLTTCVIDGRTLSRGLYRLPSTLREVYLKHKPGLIVVASSCTSTLLSVDLEAEIKEAALPPGASQVLLYTPNPYRVEENEAAETLLSLITRRFAIETLPPTPEPSVNIIGPSSLGFHHKHDLVSLKRMLAALGLSVNVVYPLGSSLEEVKKLSQAWVTIAPYRELGYDSAKWLEATYGIPAVLSTPIGIHSTRQWIAELIEALSRFARKRGLHFENPKLDPSGLSLDKISSTSGLEPDGSYLPQVVEQIQRSSVFIFGDFTHALALTKMLSAELGVKVVGAGTYDLNLQEEFERAIKPYTNNILVSDRFEEVTNWAMALKPTLLLGSHLERQLAAKLGIPCVVISSPAQIQDFPLGYEPLLGFDGSNYILDGLYQASFKIAARQPDATPVEISSELYPAEVGLSPHMGGLNRPTAGGAQLGWGELVKPFTDAE